MRVTDNLGAWATAQAGPLAVTADIAPNALPVADLMVTADNGEAPLAVGFIASGSSDSDGYIVKYEWDFDGDGEYDLDSGSDPTVIHTYTMAGTFNAAVRVTDGNPPKKRKYLSKTWGPPHYALAPNGTEKWSYTAAISMTAAPAIGDDGTIYLSCHSLYAINPDGSEKWVFPNYSKPSAPAVGDDGVVYFGSSNNNVYAVNPDGTERWSCDTGFSVNAVSLGHDGTVYACSEYGKVFAINADGSIKWTYVTTGVVWDSAAIDGDDRIYFGDSVGRVYCLDVDGNTVWSYDTGGATTTPAISDDGVFIIGSENGSMYAFGPAE